jgi:hypothetical protein
MCDWKDVYRRWKACTEIMVLIRALDKNDPPAFEKLMERLSDYIINERRR